MVVGLRITWYGRLEKGKRYHKWLSEASLMEKYPRLFANSEQNKALVEEVGLWRGEEWTWQFEWEKVLVDSFRKEVDRVRTIDTRWGGCENLEKLHYRAILSQECYDFLLLYNFEQDEEHVFKQIWHLPVPCNTQAFVEIV